MNEEYLIKYLEQINNVESDRSLSTNMQIRSLMNITMPHDLSDEFYVKQDQYLSALQKQRSVVDVNTLPLVEDKIALFQGDITTLRADAIVNAANSRLLGCFHPLHHCIDNAIHSYAGLQVRRDLMRMMEKQGFDEPNGSVKVTLAYNLPSKYIFHTVGPIVSGVVTASNEDDLAGCYRSCLLEADRLKISNIVFCSISTGVFGYPIDKASVVAVRTVRELLPQTFLQRVVFNLFSDYDFSTYRSLFLR